MFKYMKVLILSLSKSKFSQYPLIYSIFSLILILSVSISKILYLFIEVIFEVGSHNLPDPPPTSMILFVF